MIERFPHQRFEKMIRPRGNCWLWTGSKNSEGYGRFTIGSRTNGTREQTSAHIFSYRFYNGPVPPGRVVYRVCVTNGCIKPEHLRTGSRRDCVKVAMKNGRWKRGDPTLFPKNQCGQKNPNAKLTDEETELIRRQKGIVKAIILSRRHNVAEGTIYHIWKSQIRAPTEKNQG